MQTGATLQPVHRSCQPPSSACDFWHLVVQKHFVDKVLLQRQHGLTRYHTASCLFSPNSKDQILYNLSETNDCTTEMIGITCLSSYSQYLFHVRYPCSLCGTLGCNSDSWTYNMGSSQCSRNACKLSASLEVYYHNIWIV